MTPIYRLIRILAKTMVLICLVSPVAGQDPEIVTTVAFTEGPTVDREGNVYFSDIMNQRIMKLGATACSLPTARTATWLMVC